MLEVSASVVDLKFLYCRDPSKNSDKVYAVWIIPAKPTPACDSKYEVRAAFGKRLSDCPQQEVSRGMRWSLESARMLMHDVISDKIETRGYRLGNIHQGWRWWKVS